MHERGVVNPTYLLQFFVSEPRPGHIDRNPHIERPFSRGHGLDTVPASVLLPIQDKLDGALLLGLTLNLVQGRLPREVLFDQHDLTRLIEAVSLVEHFLAEGKRFHSVLSRFQLPEELFLSDKERLPELNVLVLRLIVGVQAADPVVKACLDVVDQVRRLVHAVVVRVDLRNQG